MKEPRGQQLIRRYKKHYGIPVDAQVTEEMILRHWELEKRLTTELLASNPDNRWQVFQRCYNTLYGELEWLNQLIGADVKTPPSRLHENWLYLIGQPPKRVYEIGSGKGEMITYLASRGFECKATEISQERGQRHTPDSPNLSWGISDGVHLGRFEAPDSYDVVISNQVIEHLHPDDLYEHFKGVLFILSRGGRYIFATPHRFAGPSDISRVFKCDRPMGMHLREYTHQELKELLVLAGFKDVRAVFRVPPQIGGVLRRWVRPRASRRYLTYLCVVEKLISALPRHRLRRKVTWLARVAFVFPNIFIVAEK